MKPNLLIIIFISAVCFYCTIVTQQINKNISTPKQYKEEPYRGGRIKRKVLFLPKAVWFMRLNSKINMFNYTTIFAHGWGFKITYELPTTLSKKKLFFKRNAANFDLEDYLSWVDKGQFYHVMDQICNFFLRDSTYWCGVSCQLQKIIKSSNGTDGALFQSFIEQCNHYSKKHLQLGLD